MWPHHQSEMEIPELKFPISDLSVFQSYVHIKMAPWLNKSQFSKSFNANVVKTLEKTPQLTIITL